VQHVSVGRQPLWAADFTAWAPSVGCPKNPSLALYACY